MNALYNHETIPFCLPKDRKPMARHLLRCRGFAVVHYSFTSDALDMTHPRLSLNWGYPNCCVHPPIDDI